jgi:hypothetical protein
MRERNHPIKKNSHLIVALLQGMAVPVILPQDIDLSKLDRAGGSTVPSIP